jgi:hypothetical protein
MPAHLIRLDLICLIIFGGWVQFMKQPCSQTPSVYALPLTWETKFHTIQNNWQSYGFVYFNLYIPRLQVGRQKTEPNGSKHSPN